MTTITVKKPKLYPLQQKALFNQKRYAICEASTKSGKTHGALAWLSCYAFQNGEEGHNFWWVAPIYAQAKIAFNRMALALKDTVTSNKTELSITLPHGAVIHFKSGEKPDNLYGEDVYAAVLDEATRMREESYHAIRSTLTFTKGPIRIIGNMRGRKNWAYRLARKAENHAPNMSYTKMTCWDAVDAGVLDKREIEDAQENLPDHIFKELYEVEASDDGGNPFGLDSIDSCISPFSDKPTSVYGVDLAKKADWTVVVGLDDNNHTTEVHRWQHKPWPETIEKIAGIIGSTETLADETGLGSPVVDALQEMPNTRVEGFTITSANRQELLDDLAMQIKRTLIGFPEGIIPNELREFEYVRKRDGWIYAVDEGLHDDSTFALALANRLNARPIARYDFYH